MVKIETIDKMLDYGGSFVKALAHAWLQADPINKKKLEDNFDYFKTYEELKIKF